MSLVRLYLARAYAGLMSKDEKLEWNKANVERS